MPTKRPLATPIDELVSFFEASLAPGVGAEYQSSYNVAPTDSVLGLLEEDSKGRVLDEFRWGLIPWWAKDLTVGSRTFNARAESLASKPAYRDAFEKRRLAVVADGFLMSGARMNAASANPSTSRGADHEPMAFAGLWSVWRDRSGKDEDRHWLRSCTIITTDANKEVATVHDRMPAILEQDVLERWIDPSREIATKLQGAVAPR